MSRRRQGRRDQAVRHALAPLVASGRAVCWRCQLPISPGQAWDAGHVDDLALGGDPDGERLPEHASCNRSAGAKLGRQLTPRRRLRPRFFLAADSHADRALSRFPPDQTTPRSAP